VNWKLASATIAHVLRDSGASLVFADAGRRNAAGGDLPVLGLEDIRATAGQETVEPVAPGPDELAMILYTSGSTGVPKGVPLTHHGQLWAIEHRLAGTPGVERHRLLVAAPFFHMNALCVTAFALCGGASVALLPRFSAPAYVEAIGRHRCTWLTAVPTMIAMAVRETEALARTDLSSVERVAMGSAPLGQALVDRVKALFPGALVGNGYGTTETGPVAFGPHPRGVPRPDTALGYPAEGVDLRLVAGADMDADEGVLHLRTPALMPGYLNLPAKTAQVMTADGYYVTGDVMRRDADGFYHFVGRADDMFVCGGENIYPGEVEAMLERHPEIRQACVVPVPDELKGAKPVAFVVPVAGAAPSPQAIREWALAHGPAYQHPRHVLLVPELPLAGTGKIDRAALTARARGLGESAGVAQGSLR
jgi:acyl-CoA synthetase (AMP-forming)/AMP-acid ligase II